MTLRDERLGAIKSPRRLREIKAKRHFQAHQANEQTSLEFHPLPGRTRRRFGNLGIVSRFRNKRDRDRLAPPDKDASRSPMGEAVKISLVPERRAARSILRAM